MDFYTTQEICDKLDVNRRTLFNWRAKGYGPIWVKLGQDVKYPKDDFNEWMKGLKNGGSATH